MEVTALCIQILMNLLLLLSTLPGQSCTSQKPVFPIISPDKLQFFEYKSVYVSCGRVEDMKESRLMRKLYKMNSTNKSEDCSFPAPTWGIDPTFERHSGEYWCENDEGERSQALNISVTAGSVILEFTAQPVEEGSDVTLHCVNKNNEQTEIADFYKDGLLLKTNYENYNLTLQKVSKSDEGFYKCSISGAGDSPESWLAVGGPGKGSNKETQPVRYLTPVIIILLCCLGSVLLVTGLILLKTRKGLINETVTDLNDTAYAVIDKPRMTNGGDAANRTGRVTYAAVQIRKKEREVCAAPIGQYSSDQQPIYSLLSI